MAIFMKLDNIKGSVTAKPYQGWIELKQVKFNASRRIESLVGRKRKASAHLLHIADAFLVKDLDDASNPIFEALLSHKVIPKAEIHVCSTGSDLLPYRQYHLDNVLVTNHEEIASGGGQPSEVLEFNFTKFSQTYTGRDGHNKSKSPSTMGYDLETGQLI